MRISNHFRVRLATLMVGLGLAVGLVAAIQTPALAAPARNDSQNETVYFVHGFDLHAKQDCSAWSAAISKFRSLGWTGKMQTVGYYDGDTNCTRDIAGASTTWSIWELSRRLAWEIYSQESKDNRSVDVVAHSMGGLIIRAAIYAMGKPDSFHKGTLASGGWPPDLYVEDVVTLSTPHKGANYSSTCGTLTRIRQCLQMESGSDFLDALDTVPNPQASGGTDWTLIGTEDDKTVPAASATGMSGAGHKVIYFSGQGLGHSDLRGDVDGPHYRNKYWNYYDNTWYTQNGTGASVIVTAKNAAYYWNKW